MQNKKKREKSRYFLRGLPCLVNGKKSWVPSQFMGLRTHATKDITLFVVLWIGIKPNSSRILLALRIRTYIVSQYPSESSSFLSYQNIKFRIRIKLSIRIRIRVFFMTKMRRFGSVSISCGSESGSRV